MLTICHGNEVVLEKINMIKNFAEFIASMPKAELHVHIEGCVEPSMLLEFAERNKIDIPFQNEKEVWAAQDYGEPPLDNFLKYHENCIRVLQKEQDFYELTYAFLEKCRKENIVYVEMMFDTQAHTSRGVEFRNFFTGLNRGRQDGKRDFGIESNWIMNFQRDHSAESSMEILDIAKPFKPEINAVGLDNYEVHDFPLKFEKVFKRAREEGYHLTSHCDCDQPNSINHIRQCLDILKVERIDHGLQVLDDQKLISAVQDNRIPLTMCPTWRPSDPGPRRVEGIREMLDLNLLVSVNTDDPSEFASRYLNNTLSEVQRHGDYSIDEVVQLISNAFESAWISEEDRHKYLQNLDDYVKENSF